MKTTSYPIFIFLLLASISLAQKDIDTFNILFPQAHQVNSGKSVELVITQGGCFQWNSSHPQVVSVTAKSNGQPNCQTKGIVQLRHVGPHSTTIQITATNIQTKQASNIPVRIRPIKRIEIVAKSKIMNINQLQDLQIKAYDKDNNMFTSLEGLKFKWELVNNSQVLSKISLKNSHLILPLEKRKNIQSTGHQSDILVIKGEGTGRAKVRVKCIQPGYQDLNHQIIIQVHQRFDISPSQTTYIMVDSQFNFNLVSPSNQIIPIPKPYYKTTLSSNKFTITDSLVIKAPSTADITELIVQDTRTDPPYSSKVTVHAKQPNLLELIVDDYLIIGQQGKINYKFYWNNNALTGNNPKPQIQTNLIYNQANQTVKGDKKTTGIVKIKYRQLTKQKKVTIVSPIKPLLPGNKLYLPTQQSFDLKVIGGSGSYEYKIQIDTIASINNNGLITSKKQGKTKVFVVDKKIPRNRLMFQLIVSQINKLIPLEEHKQLNINQYGPIYFIGKTQGQEIYTKCSQQKFDFQNSILDVSTNQNFASSLSYIKSKMNQSPNIKNALMKYALIKGGPKLFTSKYEQQIKNDDITQAELLKYAQQLENYGICSASWIKSSEKYDNIMRVYSKYNRNAQGKFHLRVYDKIKNNMGNMGENQFLMTPLSRLLWKTKGGPQPWDGLKTKVNINSRQLTQQPAQIKCPSDQAVHEMKMYKINPQTQKLLFPVNQSKTIKIVCKFPSELRIKYEKLAVDSNDNNPLKKSVIKGQLIPYDENGKSFFNASNLIYDIQEKCGNFKLNQYGSFIYDPSNAVVTFSTSKIALQPKNKIDKWSNITFKQISVSFNYNTQQMFEVSYAQSKQAYAIEQEIKIQQEQQIKQHESKRQVEKDKQSKQTSNLGRSQWTDYLILIFFFGFLLLLFIQCCCLQTKYKTL